MSKKNVTVRSILVSKWLPNTKQMLDVAVLEMATDIHERANILAPVDTSNLVSSGRIRRVDTAHYEVSYGGNAAGFNVPYAKRRHYENKKNPQTLGYLSRAGDGVARGDIKRYLRGVK